ncbi:MAG: hypothetical protein WAK26_10600 [Terracidiphilus sp.]
MHAFNDIPGQDNLPSHEGAYGPWKGKPVYLHDESEPLPEDGLLY